MKCGLQRPSLGLLFSAAGPAQAAASPARNGSPAATRLGNDVSWPQCNRTLPKSPAFTVVGVNNGLANTTNPCLATELAWAEKSAGGTGQPPVKLYVNTADDDANSRGLSQPGSYLWLLDVETDNSNLCALRSWLPAATSAMGPRVNVLPVR